MVSELRKKWEERCDVSTDELLGLEYGNGVAVRALNQGDRPMPDVVTT